jgi:multidrug efflux pump subunit AcrA (membrane-fusion protein)
VIQISDGLATGKDDLQVPIASLFDAGKGPGVWVITGEPTKVSWQPVTVQRFDDDTARVSGQIKRGDRIVALGAHLLKADEEVRVAETTVATAVVGVRP